MISDRPATPGGSPLAGRSVPLPPDFSGLPCPGLPRRGSDDPAPVSQTSSLLQDVSPRRLPPASLTSREATRAAQPIQTVLRLQNSRMPCADSSLPYPEFLTPPNGSCG